MSFPKFIFLGSVVLFVGIGALAAVKKIRQKSAVKQTNVVEMASVVEVIGEVQKPPPQKKIPLPATQIIQPMVTTTDTAVVEEFPVADRIHQLFSTKGDKLPIVETLSYRSRVDWLKGRPAWIADYAAYYSTSRHFIARSLNGKADYFTQKVSAVSKFNVFRRDKEIQFYLLVDVCRAKLGLYYLDVGTNERVLLKTYDVCLGKPNLQAPSGCATPLGMYSLGSKIAVYKPGVMGRYLNQSVEMVRVFGTRWIPFEEGFEGCSSPAKGYGIHGAAFIEDPVSKELVENSDCIGHYESNGSIVLSARDIEELFAIVITKPAFVVVTNDFRQAKLPGIEVQTPSR